MNKWLDVNKDKIEGIEFMSYGIIEPTRKKSSYRVSPGEMVRWDGNSIELRKMISDLFFKYAKNTKKTYDCTTEKCQIPEDTMRKILNGRCAISRHFLAKFTIGLKIDKEKADKLFELHSGELNPTNRFDYIVMCALRDGDEFDDFYEDVKKYCEIDLIRERGSKE
jgi:predicted methyltransferase